TRPQERGSIVSWFAFGKPVSTAFTEPESYRMDRLMNQVTPAEADDLEATDHVKSRGAERESQEPVAYAELASSDYSHNKYKLGKLHYKDSKLPGLPAWPQAGVADGPVEWQRQVLFMKSDDPADPHYLVLNDTITN